MNELSERYLEDFAVGQTFGSGRLRIDGERALAFAAEFDPQPFHLDEAAARRSIFGGLTASGWHTAAVTMRLLVATELKPAGGIIGAGLDECRWPRPVRPGDESHVECEVIEVRPSKPRPEQGLIKLRTTTLNQDDEAVLVHVVNLVVLRRKDIAIWQQPFPDSGTHSRDMRGARSGLRSQIAVCLAKHADHQRAAPHCDPTAPRTTDAVRRRRRQSKRPWIQTGDRGSSSTHLTARRPCRPR
jgi:acyl dehydratase